MSDSQTPTPTLSSASRPKVDGDAAPNLPDRDWETSPMYLALSSRLAKTESTLANLSNQVTTLSNVVKTLTHSAPIPGAGSNVRPPPVFSPFEGPDPAKASPFIPSSISSAPDTSVAALTTQIAALSASVAQLQRLQTSQSQSQSHQSYLSRQNTQTPTPTQERHHFVGRPEGQQTPSHLGNGHGPLTGGLGAGMGGPAGMISPAIAGSSAFASGRPGINRSMSSSMAQVDGGNDKWGKFGNGNGRDWSPGPGVPGGMTPGGMNGLNGAGGAAGAAQGQAVGAAAPGAGIVVTKWEHLNLKVELLRSVAKYGIGPPNKIQARVLPFMLKGSDIIAQAPPTQERIIAYVIPALQLCLGLPPVNGPYRGPSVVIITTTVDQANQCHKLVRSVGGPLGVRSAVAAGMAGSSGLPNEIAQIQREAVQLLVGTPAKIAEVISPRGLNGSEVKLLILDEVDQLIARNLYEHVLSVTKLLPSPRRGAANNVTGPLTPSLASSSNLAPFSPGNPNVPVTSPFDPGMNSPFNPASKTPFPSQATAGPGPSRFGAPGAPPPSTPLVPGVGGNGIERQTCIFSNTIPTDVINFSQQLQVRDPVRVLVRREGGVNSQESVSSVTPGINIKHTYVYLTITGSARSDAPASTDSGPGTIGSGRANGGQVSEEASRAKEYKLDMLVKLLDDYPLWQAVIHVGTFSMLEAVVFKLAGRQWETLYLAPDMPSPQKKAILQQWRHSIAGTGPRFLVIFDVNVKPPEIPWAPLVINFDLPRSVEIYAHRAAAAVPPATRGQGPHVNGVICSFVQAAGGDVEMLRSTECAYRFKSAEIPSVFHDLFQH